MAVPNPEFPSKGPLPLSAGNRPLPVGGGNRPISAGAGLSRPIPLSTKNGDNLPEAFEEYDPEEPDDLREALRNAPAWLVSTVFHMLILVILGVWAAATQLILPDAPVEVATFSEPLEPGLQLDDATVTEGTDDRNENPHDEFVLTPKNLPPEENPLAAPQIIGDLQIGSGIGLGPVLSGPSLIDGAPIGLALSGRRPGSKIELKRKFGAPSDLDKYVYAGLDWLVKQQRADGLWSLAGPYSDASRSENTAAATAMALLAFQGDGHTHKEGRYRPYVDRAWKALLKVQGKNGLINGTMTERSHTLYTHAQCTIALCEILGMSKDSTFREPAQRAINYCVESQDKKLGGWRYEANYDTDTSVTGWFMMALQSARMAGLKVPDDSLDRIAGYLDIAQIDGGRRYGYWKEEGPTNAVCAEGLLCRQYLGWKHEDERLVEGATNLLQHPIRYGGGNSQDVYYWYYMTQVAHHMQGDIWARWNDVMKKEVPGSQVQNGPEAGSWSPMGDRWGLQAGRLYVTCLSLYMLEVYYRHLPIYKEISGTVAAQDADSAPAADDEKMTNDAPSDEMPADEPPADEKPAGKPAVGGGKKPAAPPKSSK